jgi:hypothetical protein
VGARNAAARRADNRERSLVRAIEARLCGLADADRVLCSHVRRHPRDAVAVGLALPTIAFGGLAQPAEESWALADWLAPSYGDDWWFTGVLAFFRQEQSRWMEAELLAERSLALQQGSGHAAHARAHVCYETGEHTAGMEWLDFWIEECAATSRYRGHFAWHAALHALALDDAAEVQRRWLDTLAPHAVTGGRALVDSASMLWRAQISDCWPEGERPETHLPPVLATVPECLLERPATAFAAMHAAIAHAARRDLDSLHALASHARARSEPTFTEVVAPLCDGLSSYVAGDMTTAVSVLRQVLPGTARLGGSAAQREVVEDTFLRALLDAGQADEAAGVLQRRLDRRPHPNDARRLAALAR